MSDEVTFVIATYDRPDALAVALRSLLGQSHPRWKALVVGDGCDERTAAVVAGIDDRRIDYLNLDVRCGEQAGPNTVGLALATSPWIAFLNHDDVLLQDHVEYALEQLARKDADFFLGRCATAWHSVEGPGDEVRPVFEALTPASDDPGQAVRCSTNLFEPCSSWIVRTERARTVGAWRRSTAIVRTSLNDWLLRAWASGARFVFGERITALRLVTHHEKRYYRGPGSLYTRESLEHRFVEGLLAHSTADEIRRTVMAQVLEAPASPATDGAHPAWKAFRWACDRVARILWRRAGLDLYAPVYRALGRSLDSMGLRARVHHRTGDDSLTPGLEPDYAGVVRRAKRQVADRGGLFVG